MRLEIRGLNLTLSDTMIEHVQRRLDAALDRFESRIREVRVRISDVNGRKRGVDKRCLVEVLFNSGDTAVVDETGSDVYAVIDDVATRLKTIVLRHLTKRRSIARHRRVMAA